MRDEPGAQPFLPRKHGDRRARGCPARRACASSTSSAAWRTTDGSGGAPHLEQHAARQVSFGVGATKIGSLQHQARAKRPHVPMFSRLAAKIATVELAIAIHRIADEWTAGAKSTASRTSAAANGIAEAIDAHVDDRLDGPLLDGRNRRVEELVAGAKPRARGRSTPLPAPSQGCRSRAPPGRRCCRPAERSKACSSSGQSKSLEHGSARHHLKSERQKADCRIIEGEEAKELVAGSNRLDSPRLEQIVKQRSARGAEQDQRHEMPQMRCLCNDPKTGSRLRGLRCGVACWRSAKGGVRAVNCEKSQTVRS